MPQTPWPNASDWVVEGTDVPAAETLLRNWTEQCRRLPGGDAWLANTISGGAITPARAMVSLGLGPGLASGELVRINADNYQAGQIVWLRTGAAGLVVTVRRFSTLAGNLDLKSETFVTRTPNDTISLVLRADGAWEELVRHHDPAAVEALEYMGLKGAARYDVANMETALAGVSAERLVRVDQVGAMLGSYPVLFPPARAPLPNLAATDRLLVGRPPAGTGAAATPAAAGYAAVAHLLGLLRPKEFGEFEIATSGGGSFDHGLGGAPARLWGMLRCKEADHGGAWEPGNVIPADQSYGSGASRGVTLTGDASKVYYGYADQAQVFGAIDANGGTFRLLTNARWRLVVYAQR